LQSFLEISIGLFGILQCFHDFEDDFESICGILKECGGLNAIKTLEEHKNGEINKMSGDTIAKFFTLDKQKDVPVSLLLGTDFYF